MLAVPASFDRSGGGSGGGGGGSRWDDDSDDSGSGGFASVEETRQLAQRLHQCPPERAEALLQLRRMSAYDVTGSHSWPEVAAALSACLDDTDARYNPLTSPSRCVAYHGK
jgi:hypothetical protein